MTTESEEPAEAAEETAEAPAAETAAFSLRRLAQRRGGDQLRRPGPAAGGPGSGVRRRSAPTPCEDPGWHVIIQC